MKIFIGYFRSDLDLKKATSFINQLCPKIKQFQHKSKRVGVNGSASFLLATLENKKDAINAIEILQGTHFRGHPLTIHLYEERSASNERRNMNWRAQRWDGQERRKADRRHYKKYTASQNLDAPSFLPFGKPAQGISVESFSNDEARAFLKMSFKRDQARSEPKTKKHVPANNPSWKKLQYL